MTLDRVKIPITGTAVVGQAFMNFYFTSATASNLTAISVLLNAVKAYLPSTATYSLPSGGDQIDEQTGKLVGAWTAVAPAPVTGTGAAIAAAPVGFMIRWRCPAVVDGHRPVGRSIFVPASTTPFGGNGFMTGAAVSAINTAGATFLSSSAGFVVWHRPKYDYTTKPPTKVRDGSIATPNVVDTSSKAVVLTSRRD